ncbi:hypothetical protein RRG08_035720 [Elysia crispata]|uniref:Uncharacterized protein n=1 Tax=Elysia crispata TaxID=231223 RepID=A0AAE1CZF9_9GAST|nr:hypothetical protein RRG08_035720 [Elysia crispata]
MRSGQFKEANVSSPMFPVPVGLELCQEPMFGLARFHSRDYLGSRIGGHVLRQYRETRRKSVVWYYTTETGLGIRDIPVTEAFHNTLYRVGLQPFHVSLSLRVPATGPPLNVDTRNFGLRYSQSNRWSPGLLLPGSSAKTSRPRSSLETKRPLPSGPCRGRLLSGSDKPVRILTGADNSGFAKPSENFVLKKAEERRFGGGCHVVSLCHRGGNVVAATGVSLDVCRSLQLVFRAPFRVPPKSAGTHPVVYSVSQRVLS